MMLRTNYVDYMNVKCCKHNVAVFTLDAAVTIGSAVICQTSMFMEYECYLQFSTSWFLDVTGTAIAYCLKITNCRQILELI